MAEAINLWNLKADIAICLDTVDRSKRQSIPVQFIHALIVAEDRRNHVHFGVDPIGVVRAVHAHITGKGIQGASTIEQQFVRVVSGAYERTIQRKLREQALAISVSRRRSKAQIASAYLGVAYYGPDLVGFSGLRRLSGTNLETCPAHRIYTAIARLKYPEPVQPSIDWKQKLFWREAYIANRMPTLTTLCDPFESVIETTSRLGGQDTRTHLQLRSNTGF